MEDRPYIQHQVDEINYICTFLHSTHRCTEKHGTHPTNGKSVQVGAVDSIQDISWLHERVGIPWLSLQAAIAIHQFCHFDHSMRRICAREVKRNEEDFKVRRKRKVVSVNGTCFAD